MQLSRLYSSDENLFVPIDFNCREDGVLFNVVFAEIRRPEDRNRDSHNLGKTTLIHVLDFMMLREIAGTGHIFEKHSALFGGLVLFLELALNSGDYLTIRRPVSDAVQLSLKRHDSRGVDLSAAAPDAWDHAGLGLAQARDLVDGILNLQVLTPYDYRKALTYFLRTQQDYSDELQLHKFMLGKDVDWKPFVMHLFGFSERPVRRKYELDTELEELRLRKEEQATKVQFAESEIAKLSTQIESKRADITAVEGELDAFSFHEQEKRVMYDVVTRVEARISAINEALYNSRSDIDRIESALGNAVKFDLKEIEQIFAEAQLYFGGQIKKDYEDLVQFNSSITRERNASLRKQLATLRKEHEQLLAESQQLNRERAEKMSAIRTVDTFDKFKRLQKSLTDQKAEIVYLEGQLERLKELANVTLRINALLRDRSEAIDEIKVMLTEDSDVRKRFALLFNEYCRRVLGHNGVFFLKQNSAGNVIYEIQLELPGMGKEVPSSLDRGNSYKKLLCALFDLALLKVYQDKAFFHFVYHDGVLEGLDNRKKLLFLELVREVIAEGRLQYVFSVIDSDLPRGQDSDAKLPFSDDEVVLRLHDEGNEGRLFRMAEF